MPISSGPIRLFGALLCVISIALQSGTALAGGAHGRSLGDRTASSHREAPLESVRMQTVRHAQRASLVRSRISRQQTLAVQAGAWTEVGPQLIDTNGTDPEKWATGRVLSLAYANSRLYAGSAGGVWTSTDWGRSWSTTTDTQLTSLIVGALAVDPKDPNVVYAGTGFGASFDESGDGIYKSTDAGRTWTQVTGDALARTDISAIVVDPTNPQRVYAGVMDANPKAGPFGVLASTDGGQHWSYTNLKDDKGNYPNITDLTIDGHGGIYAAIGGKSDPSLVQSGWGTLNGVFYSADGGQSWSQVSDGLPSQTQACASDAKKCGGWYRITLLPSSAGNQPNGQVLAAAVSDGDGRYLTGLYRTSDGGASWTDITGNLESSNSCDYTDGGTDQAAGNMFPAFGPDGALYVGRVDIFKTSGWRGSNPTWTDVSHGYTKDYDHRNCADFTQGQTHVDQHAALTVGGRMYFANDGGIFYTDNGGQTYASANGQAPHALAVAQFYGGAISSRADRILAGTQDNGTLLGTWTGTGYSWKEIMGGDGGYPLMDPADSNVMYVENPNAEIDKSTNGGSTDSWVATCPAYTSQFSDGTPDCSKLSEDSTFATPLVMDPSDPQTVYSGLMHLWRTMDGGKSWVKIGPPGNGFDTISAIAVAPHNPNTVYVGDSAGHTWVTTDARAPASSSWRLLDSTNKCQTLSPNCSGESITGIAVDPTDASGRTVYITIDGYEAGGHVLRSNDGGTTWTDVSGSLPAIPFRSVVVAPNGTVYAGANRGVYVSSDRGASWKIMGTALPNAWVNALVLNGSTLYAFTYGRGIWRIDTAAPLSLHITGLGISYVQGGKEMATTSLRLRQTGTFKVAYTIANAQGLKPTATLHFWYRGTWYAAHTMNAVRFSDGRAGFSKKIYFTHADRLGTWTARFRITVGSSSFYRDLHFKVTA